ncbi:hypothetical protein P9112_012852 [Eukaryota sp. TZLM1-RC]
MSDTHSVTSVQQIRTDLPLVTEICHEASLLLQSFLLNFPLASRALVEQDVWCLFMTFITTGSFPKPSTYKGQSQLLLIFYSEFFPECPQDRSLVSSWENTLVPYRYSFNLFLNDWLQSQKGNFINRKGLSPYLACRARQLASNVKTSLPKICQSWTKKFIRAHCRALDKTNVCANFLFSLLPDKLLVQIEEVVVDSVIEHYINFNLNNSKERFFLLNACKFILNLLQRFHVTASLLFSQDKITFSSKEIGELFLFNLKNSQYLLTFFSHMLCFKKFRKIPLASHKGSKFHEVPSQIFHSVKKFPLIERSSSKTKFIKNTRLKRKFKQCFYQEFYIKRKSLKNSFEQILWKTNGNELVFPFQSKNYNSESTDELDEPPKKKRRLKKEMKSDPDANKTRET